MTAKSTQPTFKPFSVLFLVWQGSQGYLLHTSIVAPCIGFVLCWSLAQSVCPRIVEPTRFPPDALA